MQTGSGDHQSGWPAIARIAALSAFAAATAPIHAQGAAPRYDPKPWLEDLAQAREAFATKYANLEWAAFGRQADLDDYFARARKRIELGSDGGDARAAFDGLARRLGDGHVEFEWPQKHLSKLEPTRGVCGALGYDSERAASPLAALAKDYAPLARQSPTFPAGVIVVGAHRIGVLKIGLFSPQGTPSLCKAALAALSIPPDEPCNDACGNRIDKWTTARMNEDFIAQIEALKRAKIDTLLVDVAGNGGGTEWAEAAARMLTPIRLKSERMDFVRDPQWTKEFADLEKKLRDYAKAASPADRAFLLKLAEEAAVKRAIAATPCDSAPLWKGKHPACSWLGQGFYASGVLASADPATLRGKSWAATVFTPMEFPYREGVWRGPLIVLVDRNSWSAAEEFAAVLQDNRAAIVMGEPTGGAGCGHTDGAAPTVLRNSGGKLELPDCARIRADGTNEVRGILPDVWAGWRRFDGPRLRAAALLAKLPEAVRRAEAFAR